MYSKGQFVIFSTIQHLKKLYNKYSNQMNDHFQLCYAQNGAT